MQLLALNSGTHLEVLGFKRQKLKGLNGQNIN